MNAEPVPLDHSIRPGDPIEIEDYHGLWHPRTALSPVRRSAGRDGQQGRCHVIVRNGETGEEYGWPAEYVRRAQLGLTPRCPMPEPVPLILVIDGTDHLVDVARWVSADVPPADRPYAMTKIVQGWLTRSDVVELPVIGGPPLLANWRAIEFFEVRLP